jgi:carboxymethylenebutenolidase
MWSEAEAADGFRPAVWRDEPAQGAPRGLVVVAQEIFGVNGHIRDVCARFSKAGFLAVAPALFDRQSRGIELGYDEAGIARGRDLKGSADPDLALADLAAARALAPELPAAVVGFCWGGLLAWLAACRQPGFAAAVSYYGGGIGRHAGETPRCPVLLHFGEKDQAIPQEEVRSLRDAHPGLPVHLYPAGHGFNCDQRGSFDAPSAALAWERTLAFLDAGLKR